MVPPQCGEFEEQGFTTRLHEDEDGRRKAEGGKRKAEKAEEEEAEEAEEAEDAEDTIAHNMSLRELTEAP